MLRDQVRKLIWITLERTSCSLVYSTSRPDRETLHPLNKGLGQLQMHSGRLEKLKKSSLLRDSNPGDCPSHRAVTVSSNGRPYTNVRIQNFYFDRTMSYRSRQWHFTWMLPLCRPASRWLFLECQPSVSSVQAPPAVTLHISVSEHEGASLSGRARRRRCCQSAMLTTDAIIYKWK